MHINGKTLAIKYKTQAHSTFTELKQFKLKYKIYLMAENFHNFSFKILLAKWKNFLFHIHVPGAKYFVSKSGKIKLNNWKKNDT